MAAREWIRVGACAVIGLVIGLILANLINNVSLIFLMPFYAIGTLYGIRVILNMLGGVGKLFGKMAGFSAITFNRWGCLISFLGIIFGLVIVLTFGWIIGLFFAGKAIFNAYKTDSSIKMGDESSDYDEFSF